MDITWLGHSCFRLHDAAMTVVTDPYPASIGLGSIPGLRRSSPSATLTPITTPMTPSTVTPKCSAIPENMNLME